MGISAVIKVRALTFDVFGTMVDWYSSIVREGQALNAALPTPVDWGRFANAWRAGYRPAMDRVLRGELPWHTIDQLHRMILDELLPQFGITGWDEAQIEHFNRVWHRLIPWADAIPGLLRLRTRYVVAALSNGNTGLLLNMAKWAGLPWDCIFSADLVHRYKPDPLVYQTAADLLGLPPSQVMMVAAHQNDLRAAQAVGFRTAFVPRPLEFGPQGHPDLTPDPSFDLVAGDFIELADKLGT